MAADFLDTVETVLLSTLRPHPRNYRRHPDDQLAHIEASINAHGVYRPIIATTEGTILAGHGVALALERMGRTEAPVYRLDIDPDSPVALKLLAGDNEIEHLAEQDDRLLSELLKEIHDRDELIGSGFDEQQLAALVFVTRPASEVADFDAAAHWVGMPEYEQVQPHAKLVLTFETKAHREELIQQLNLNVTKPAGENSAWAAWYPRKEREDHASLKFDG